MSSFKTRRFSIAEEDDMVVFFCNNKICPRYAHDNSCVVMCLVGDRVEICSSCGYDHCIVGDCRGTLLPANISHICNKKVHDHDGHS